MENPREHELIIEKTMEGTRIDKALSLLLPEISRSHLASLIEEGRVCQNNSPCLSKKKLVAEGDVIWVSLPEPALLPLEAENLSLHIAYEDEDVLVIDKEKGMVVHPAPGNPNGTLVNGILYHCKESLSSINGVIRPGIVHRIDKDTTGLLMVAKNDLAHKSLAWQLAEHTIDRGYLALVHDNIKEDQGLINKPIGRDPSNRLRRKVTEHHSKDAVTGYRVLERFGQYTLIEARLKTGRTHQIRVHMTNMGHPLVGDTLYGPKKNALGVRGQLLHAFLLGFVHPATGESMVFTSKLPPEFREVLQKLREGNRP